MTVRQPLVLLHGFTGQPASWDRVLAMLPAPAEAHAYALAGHGPVATPRTFEAEVDRLAHLIASDLGSKRACLCGYSLGGRLALGLLVRHPALFASAVVIGASPGLATLHERAERAATDERWAALLTREGLDRFLDAWENAPLFATQRSLPGEVLREQRRQRRRHSAAGLARALQTLGLARMPNLAPDLVRIDRPIVFVAGEHDAKFQAIAEGMRSRSSRAKLAIAPGAGHNVVLEQPAWLAQLLERTRAV